MYYEIDNQKSHRCNLCGNEYSSVVDLYPCGYDYSQSFSLCEDCIMELHNIIGSLLYQIKE